MSDFRLGSIDWDDVRLLHGQHLSHETGYLEDLVRWVVYCGLPAGVIRMDPDSLTVVQSSTTTYRVTLRRFKALTHQGYWVQVGDDESNPTCDLDRDRHLEQVANIYVGVDMREKDSREHAPSLSSALLECRSRWPHYALDTTEASGESDWLQIGQVVNQGGTLALDPEFIPECVYLSAHPRLRKAAEEIRDAATTGLETLARYAQANDTVRLLAGLFCSATGPAAALVDWDTRPPAYLQRMAGLLTANRSLAGLCPPNTGYRDDAIQACERAVSYLHDNADGVLLLGPAFSKVRDALKTLVSLYGQLVAAPAPTAPPPPTEPKDHQERPFRVIRRT